jgi:hypothetical protein
MRISSLFKRLRRWSSQAFRKRHSPAAFRNCRNADNSVFTAEGTTSKGTRSISCEVEFCIFYRLILISFRTKDVVSFLKKPILEIFIIHSEITLHVSGALCTHNQEYIKTVDAITGTSRVSVRCRFRFVKSCPRSGVYFTISWPSSKFQIPNES